MPGGYGRQRRYNTETQTKCRQNTNEHTPSIQEIGGFTMRKTIRKRIELLNKLLHAAEKLLRRPRVEPYILKAARAV